MNELTTLTIDDPRDRRGRLTHPFLVIGTCPETGDYVAYACPSQYTMHRVSRWVDEHLGLKRVRHVRDSVNRPYRPRNASLKVRIITSDSPILRVV